MGEKILLSMIGTRDYEKVEYRWGDKSAVTALIQEALFEWFPDWKKLILATPEAKDKYGRMLERIGTEIVDIPNGKNQREHEQIFDILVQKLPQDAEVVLDITHGFRLLPVLVLLGMSFLRAAKNIQIRHLLYGAYQENQAVAPVIDLVSFVRMLDWASATNRFMETGDVRRLAHISGEFAEDLENSVRHLQAFSSALQLHYPLQAGQAAGVSLEALKQARNKLPVPMRILEERLLKGISPIAFSDRDPPEQQLSALFHQVLWYYRHGHYEKAVGLASEWIHLFAKWKVGQDIWSEKFSFKHEIERRPNEDWANELKNLHEEIKRLRDHISHWQFKRKSELSPSELVNIPQKVGELTNRLETLVRSTGLKLEEPS